MLCDNYLEWHTKHIIPDYSLKNFFNAIKVIANTLPLPEGAEIIRLSSDCSISKSCYWKSNGYLIYNFFKP